jgi:hypothetical protein
MEFNSALEIMEMLKEECPDEIETLAAETLEDMEKEAGIGGAITNFVAKAGSKLVNKGVGAALEGGLKGGVTGAAKNLVGRGMMTAGNFMATKPGVAAGIAGGVGALGAGVGIGKAIGKKEQQPVQNNINVTASELLDQMYEEKVAEWDNETKGRAIGTGAGVLAGGAMAAHNAKTAKGTMQDIIKNTAEGFKAQGLDEATALAKATKATNIGKGIGIAATVAGGALAGHAIGKAVGKHVDNKNQVKTASELLDLLYEEKITEIEE